MKLESQGRVANATVSKDFLFADNIDMLINFFMTQAGRTPSVILVAPNLWYQVEEFFKGVAENLSWLQATDDRKKVDHSGLRSGAYKGTDILRCESMEWNQIRIYG